MLQTDSPTIRPSDRAEREPGNGECDGHTARYAGARAIEFGAAAKDAAGGGRCGAAATSSERWSSLATMRAPHGHIVDEAFGRK